jgi:hypothetical protein
MKNSWIPLVSFALAILISAVAAPPKVLGRRLPTDPTDCNASGTVQSAHAKATAYDIVYDQIQVQVDASDSSTLKINAIFGMRAPLDINFPPPQTSLGTLLFWNTDLKPAAQTKDYTGAISKLETDFKAFSIDGKTVLGGAKRALAQKKKDSPDLFAGSTGTTLSFYPTQQADLTITGTYVCKKNGQGKLTALNGDVPLTDKGNGEATCKQGQ